MKTLSNNWLTGVVTGLLVLLGAFRIDLLACAMMVFAIWMVAWTYEQYDHHHHLH